MTSENQGNDALTREEAKRILRKLELDAYSAVVSAFRAQGDINKSKKALLEELSSNLSISTERHRAELRRAVNDDRLKAVASCFNGSSTEWVKESRRLVSLMPRLVPQTVFTAKASIVANKTKEKNEMLPLKSSIELHPVAVKHKQVTSPSLDSYTERVETKLQHSISQDSALSRTEEKRKKRKLSNSIVYSKPYSLVTSKVTTAKYPTLQTSNKLTSNSDGLTLKMNETPHFLSKSLTASIPSRSFSNLHGNMITPSVKTSSNPNLLNHISLIKGQPLSPNKTNCLDGTKLTPLVKVVSNPSFSQFESASSTSAILQNNLSHRITFKTPITPKNTKLKATSKLKQAIPVQKASPIVLQADPSQSSTSNTRVINSVCKSVLTSHSNVKVVQVARGSLPNTTLSLTENINSALKLPAGTSILKNDTIVAPRLPSQLSSLATPSLSITNSSVITSLSSNLAKGTITGKSLATGFKMIAVTTVIPGTTQIKTVYIATPIMSLNKPLSILNSIQTSTVPVPIPKPSTVGATYTSFTDMKTFNNISKNLRTATLLPLKSSITDSTVFPSLNLSKTLKVSSNKSSVAFKTISSTSTPTQNVKIISCTLKGKVTSPSNILTSKTISSPLIVPPSIANNLLSDQNKMKQAVLRQNAGHTNLKIESEKAVNTPGSTNYVISVYNKNTPFPSSILNTISASTAASSVITTPVNATKVTVSASRPEDFQAVLNLLNNADGMKVDSVPITSGTTTIDGPNNLSFLTENEKFLEHLSMRLSNAVTSSSSNDKVVVPIELNIPPTLPLPNSAINCMNKENMTTSSSSSSLSQSISFSDSKLDKLLVNSKPSLMVLSSKASISSSVSSTCTPAPSVTLVTITNAVNDIKAVSNSLKENKNLFFDSVTKSSVEKSKLNHSHSVSLKNSCVVTNCKISDVTTTQPVKNQFPQIVTSFSPAQIEPVSTVDSKPILSTKRDINTAVVSVSPIVPLMNAVEKNNSFTNNINKNKVNCKVDSKNLIVKSCDNEKNASNEITTSSKIISPVRKPIPSVTSSTLEESSRKRKLKELVDPTTGMIAPIYSRTQASWIRGATNLLQRVCRFRGTNKQKGEMNAASWFTKPVDPVEEPGYYRVIKTPMDFGKIRRKLEDGEYVSYPHFYEDMMQIKRNCYMYNPEGHIVRKDCDDVFSFFQCEYEKLLERWEKRNCSPQKKIKIMAADTT